MTEQEASDPSARAHARLSASGSKRWMTCPGSVALIDEVPAAFKTSSVHANRGTAAHVLVEVCLGQRLEDCRQYEDYWIHVSGQMQRAAPVEVDGEDDWFIVDHDMMSAVDLMLDTVYDELARLGPQAEMRLEHKFDLSWVRPDMFGTSDVSISLFLDELVVIDYKHGQGVAVDVVHRNEDTGELEGNSQLLYYALGVAKDFDFTHETVTLVIVQPRCPHLEGPVRRFSVSMADLRRFERRLGERADVVREAEEAYAAIRDESDWAKWQASYLRAGDHCRTTFCAKLATCPAAARRAQEIAQVDFADDPFPIEPPTAEEDMQRLSHVLRWAKFLDGFVKAAKAYGMKAEQLGMHVPGHKVIRGKSTRQFVVGEDEVVERVGRVGVAREDLYTAPKLKSPAQLEKLGKEVKSLVNGVPNPDYNPDDPTSTAWIEPPLAQKRPGKLTLVHESEPGEAVSIDAAADFDDDYARESEED